ncbi:hypothetical protein MMC25_001499 [Agyrium rufum]|nr:hypothetical protein [Agyrium rufum]
MAEKFSEKKVATGRRRPSSISSISSATSIASPRVSHDGLLEEKETPPASPTLQLLSKRKSNPFRLNNAWQLVLKALAVILTLTVAYGAFRWYTGLSNSIHYDVGILATDGEKLVLVNAEDLPRNPTPVVVTYARGKSKWTASIPQQNTFPLRPSEYKNLCIHSKEVSEYFNVQQGHSGRKKRQHYDYYRVDPNFLDVSDAEAMGLLPPSDPAVHLDANGKVETTNMEVCERSLTYVMETTDAGFGNTLMGLWMAYGLAVKEDRAFFVDDRYWAYGNYTTLFKPPPPPSCLPPPESQRLPCPHHARHLLVSAATIPWTFGSQFEETFEDAHKVGVLRQHNIFAFLRTGYEALFRLATSDAEYVGKRMHDLDFKIRDKGGKMIGIHVRHGDRHPWEYQYQKSYIPLTNYVDAARETIITAATVKGNGTKDHEIEMMSKMVLASDDPDVYTSVELSNSLKAQELIHLASKEALKGEKKPKGKFVEENLGWEGGFYSDVFWELGDTTPMKSARSLRRIREMLEKEERGSPSHLALQLREYVGRSYLMDLAVLGKSDRIVCGVSSVACRLLAVMMGWEKGIVGGDWVNVDGDFDWKGIVW